jgi:zinc transporter 7
MVEEKRHILVGYVMSPIMAIIFVLLQLGTVHPNVNAPSCSLGIFIGFSAFFMMEKTLRVLSGGETHTHSHEGHGDLSNATTEESTSSAIEPHSSSSGMRSRNQANTEQSDKHEPQLKDASNAGGPSKLSAYLNLFGDFVHNM